MHTYTLELTPIEIACGVTLEQVADLMPKILLRDGRAYLPENTPPALCGAVARCAFGGPAQFVGISKATGYPIYEPRDN